MRSIEANKGRLPSQPEINPKENISAMTHRCGKELLTQMPASMSDPRTTKVQTTIPASTPDSGITKVLSTLPYSMSSSIAIENSNKGVEQTTPKTIDASAGPLKETKGIIKLADRSNLYPEDVVKDVLIRANELIFPMDFYIINMDDEFALNPTHILSGRPLMKTARTKIDVHKGLKLELKSLLKHLKYVYLENDETLPVINANDLTKV
ncbi:hypothetical protein Peur_002088 [Populus x canadensis]